MPSEIRVSEAPGLFLIEEDSEPILVNYRIKGDFYVVDRLFEKAELRVGPERSVRIQLRGKKNFFQRIFG